MNEAASQNRRRRMRLGELLLSAGVVDETHLNAALAEQKRWGGKLGRILVEMKFISEELMVKGLARHLGLRQIDLDTATLDEHVSSLMGVDLCENYGIFPVSLNEAEHLLYVATTDPTNFEALDEASFRTGHRVEAVLATHDGIERAIRRYYYGETEDAGAPHQTLDPEAYGLPAGETYDLESGNAAAQAEPELEEIVHRLERTVVTQRRALQALVSVLESRGLIDRTELLELIRDLR